uniref:Glucagon receptor b n=1 Tax=Salarias fasciatus TaxID=181472 RepID=A0A672HAI3_SALFA
MSQVCLLLALLMFCSCTKVSSANSLELVKEKWSSYKNQCLDYLNTTPPATGLVCNRTFDLYACWPDGPPGTVVNVSCPWFLPWYRKGACTWSKLRNVSSPPPVQQRYGRLLSQLRIMYTVGYSLSLGALLLALGILITFRKLHCMRNNIHMNLFASFILRAVSILVKDALLTLTLDPRTETLCSVCVFVCVCVCVSCGGQAVTWCRGAMVMMQYSVMANNYWLLVEGIYLHSLLVITVFSERKYFYIYLAIGWGAPLIFVLPWITVKYLYENEDGSLFITVMLADIPLFLFQINFFIFIRIIKILMSKLRAHQMRYTDYKFRLAKSTLTLIPLLGIHAILFTFVIDESVPKGSMLRLIRLFCDLLFNSFQGLLVAILYCFVNKEVQSEMLKKWKRWKLGKDIDEEYRHTHSQTPHVKSGSIATGNLPDLHDNNTGSDPSGDSPRLVVCYSNGTGKGRPARSRHNLRFCFQPRRGATNAASEELRLEERAPYRSGPAEGEETNV